MTEKLSEKDALYLFGTEPKRFVWAFETDNQPVSPSMNSSFFLKQFRHGEIILAPVPCEPPKPVRVPVENSDACLCFGLTVNHKREFNGEIMRSEASAYGGVCVYHLPDKREVVTPYAPLWIKDDETYFMGGHERQLLWPKEIEFSPEFLESKEGGE